MPRTMITIWNLLKLKGLQLKLLFISMLIFLPLLPLLTIFEVASIRIPDAPPPTLFETHWKNPSLFWQSMGMILLDVTMFGGSWMEKQNTVRVTLKLGSYYRRTFNLFRLSTSVGIMVICRIIFVNLFLAVVPLNGIPMAAIIHLSGWPGGFLVQNFLLLTHIPYPRRIVRALVLNVAAIVIVAVIFWLPTVILLVGSVHGILGSILKVNNRDFVVVDRLD
jgi:hypothetical protein